MVAAWLFDKVRDSDLDGDCKYAIFELEKRLLFYARMLERAADTAAKEP